MKSVKHYWLVCKTFFTYLQRNEYFQSIIMMSGIAIIGIIFVAYIILLGFVSTYLLNDTYNYETGKCSGYWFCGKIGRNYCGDIDCAMCSTNHLIYIGCIFPGIASMLIIIFILMILATTYDCMKGCLKCSKYLSDEWKRSEETVTDIENAGTKKREE